MAPGGQPGVEKEIPPSGSVKVPEGTGEKKKEEKKKDEEEEEEPPPLQN